MFKVRTPDVRLNAVRSNPQRGMVIMCRVKKSSRNGYWTGRGCSNNIDHAERYHRISMGMSETDRIVSSGSVAVAQLCLPVKKGDMRVVYNVTGA